MVPIADLRMGYPYNITHISAVVPMNNFAPMENCPGAVHGNLNWMLGYVLVMLDVDFWVCGVATAGKITRNSQNVLSVKSA